MRPPAFTTARPTPPTPPTPLTLLAALVLLTPAGVVAQDGPAPPTVAPRQETPVRARHEVGEAAHRAIAALLDTAALRRALAQLPPLADPRPVARAFVVGVGRDGTPFPPRALGDGVMPDAARDTILALLRATRRTGATLPGETAGWTTHLLVATGPAADWQGVRLDEEAASLLEPSRVQRHLQGLADRFAKDDTVPQPVRVRVRATISPEGIVEAVTVLLSTGSATADEEVLAVLRRARFRPATVDGVPVRTSVIQPFRFEVER